MHEMEIPVLPIPSVESINFTNPLILDIFSVEARIAHSLCQESERKFLSYHTNNIMCAQLCLTLCNA